MSVSTDGILAYGTNLSDGDEGYSVKVPWFNEDYDRSEMTDEEIDTAEDEDFESWWANQHGISSSALWKQYYEWEKDWKTGDYEHDSKGVEVFEEQNPEWREALDKFYEDNRLIQERCPVELIRHCSCDYPMYILAVKGHTTKASRGYPTPVSNMNVDPNAEIEAQKFCQKYGIDWQPQWWLASDWC